MSDCKVSSIGVRELKTRLGTYLGLVKKGGHIIVTDRGRPVAELVPYHGGGDSEAILEEMLLLGEASRTSSEALIPFEPIAIRGGAISDTVVDERDERI